MKLIEMRPGQIHDVVNRGLPMIFGCGVVEYHGPHLPVGTDYLIASSIVEEVERRATEACVLAPGLPFGPTGSWAAGAADGDRHQRTATWRWFSSIFSRAGREVVDSIKLLDGFERAFKQLKPCSRVAVIVTFVAGGRAVGHGGTAERDAQAKGKGDARPAPACRVLVTSDSHRCIIQDFPVSSRPARC